MSIEDEGDDEAIYQIKLQGRLEEHWSSWFSGLAIRMEEEDKLPITTLTGPVADQAALRGILDKMWDLNLTLISAVRLEKVPRGPWRRK